MLNSVTDEHERRWNESKGGDGEAAQHQATRCESRNIGRKMLICYE